MEYKTIYYYIFIQVSNIYLVLEIKRQAAALCLKFPNFNNLWVSKLL